MGSLLATTPPVTAHGIGSDSAPGRLLAAAYGSRRDRPRRRAKANRLMQACVVIDNTAPGRIGGGGTPGGVHAPPVTTASAVER